MANYQLEQVSFYYPQEIAPALEEITLKVDAGDFVLLGGPTGSGKTTLLRLLKKQTQPAGKLQGVILYDDKPMSDLSDRHSAEEIGMVFQNPDNQIIMTTVWQQLCQGMENLGYTSVFMQKRLAEIVPFFGMESWLHQRVETLSGGQKQILNLASVMMLRPKVLLLDEPTAQLAPMASNDFIDLLVRINQELSVTVVLCEHRLENLFFHASRVILMKEGAIACQGAPREVIRHIWQEETHDFLLYMPSVSRLYLQLQIPESMAEPIPMTVREGKQWFNRFYQQATPSLKNRPSAKPKEYHTPQKTLLTCQDVTFRYEPKQPPVLQRFSLELQERDFFVVLGGNGAGKSTLLKLIAGLMPHQQGEISCQKIKYKPGKPTAGNRHIGYVGQDPLAYFTRDTVEELLEERSASLVIKEDKKLKDIVEWFQLEPILKKHPFDLSGGQQQLVVLALVLLADPSILLLDEPTKGLDPSAKNNLVLWLHRLQEQGKTILMVSHDIEFAASHATRCGLLFDGAMLAVDEPRSFFSENYYYTTAVHRTVRDCLPQEVTEKGVLSSWNGWKGII